MLIIQSLKQILPDQMLNMLIASLSNVHLIVCLE